MQNSRFRNTKAQLSLFNRIIFTDLNRRALTVLLKEGLLKEPTRLLAQPTFLYRTNIS